MCIFRPPTWWASLVPGLTQFDWWLCISCLAKDILWHHISISNEGSNMFNHHLEVLDEMALWKIFCGTNNISVDTWGYQGPSQYKDCLYQYSYFRCKDKIVKRPFYFCNGNLYTGNISLYWHGHPYPWIAALYIFRIEFCKSLLKLSSFIRMISETFRFL